MRQFAVIGLGQFGASVARTLSRLGAEVIGIDSDALLAKRPGRRLLCRPCLDWSERRPHIAGALGAAICALSVTSGWVLRQKESRAVSITPRGHRIFRERFGAVLS